MTSALHWGSTSLDPLRARREPVSACPTCTVQSNKLLHFCFYNIHLYITARNDLFFIWRTNYFRFAVGMEYLKVRDDFLITKAPKFTGNWHGHCSGAAAWWVRGGCFTQLPATSAGHNRRLRCLTHLQAGVSCDCNTEWTWEFWDLAQGQLKAQRLLRPGDDCSWSFKPACLSSDIYHTRVNITM